MMKSIFKMEVACIFELLLACLDRKARVSRSVFTFLENDYQEILKCSKMSSALVFHAVTKAVYYFH